MWIFAVNERAGSGRGKIIWKLVETELQRRSLPYQAVIAESAEAACQEVRNLLEQNRRGGSSDSDLSRSDVRAVTIIGGDGTIHSILPALAGSAVPLGLIPSGSGNDTARAFGIPKQPLAALERVLQGQAVPVDLIMLGGDDDCGGVQPKKPILTALAVGFDAAIASAVNRSSYKKLCNKLGVGSLAYLIALVHMLLTYRPRPMIVTIDGKPHVYRRGWMAAICNVPAYGGGLRICPEASPSDGMLDICIVHTCTPLQLLRLFPTLLTGKHVRLPFVTMLRGQTVSVAAESMPGLDPISAFGDGEPAGQVPLHVKLASNRLLLVR
ncbi:YegS/Rv2252/BmrU family lipid kinase [Paenibacillus taihuensis]|uniref:YegS/Rv2252/BmrU family lipid kinase n=1 Tax=Paenibacillus taihuensis TaxID=1156355 RepID=A0A3D9RI97_9BACL|nr:diacylglycerol kinase family protein [Paenibacillus taihuensis]REE78799.1 YegS/Rv2252/BmrU family lipid kinase [Paenibacillus taihuensis]